MSERDISVTTGKQARKAVPFVTFGDFAPASGRDPIGLLQGQDTRRLPDLVPVRHARMSASPFAFYRGAALPMAADLGAMPNTGLRVQLCGDAHLSNFGAYASPERRLVFDLNDFDETLPGPFEWDLLRLTASMNVAARANGFNRKQRAKVVETAARSYREAMAQFAAMPFLSVWYAKLDLEDLVALNRKQQTKKQRKRGDAQITKARARDGLQALAKLTYVEDGVRRIVSDPPLIVPLEDLAGDHRPEEVAAVVRHLLELYVRSLPPDRRVIIRQFRLSQVALKVVGVGSVGTRAWIALLEPRDGTEPLLLQVKQANRSVLADYAGESAYANQGHRVVAGQRLMQAASDVLLGWQRSKNPFNSDEPIDYYMRQLRDWKHSVDTATLDPERLAVYGDLCGWTLARAHARTGDRIAIAAYLGKSPKADQAFTAFAETYADLTERDFQAHAAAIANGDIAVRE